MGKRNWDVLKDCDVTPESLFMQRRKIMQAFAAGALSGPMQSANLLLQAGVRLGAGAGLATATGAALASGKATRSTELDDMAPLPGRRWKGSAMEPPTDPKLVTTYNNFYEFGTDKGDPHRNAGSLKTRPWTVVVEGECAKPRTFSIEELLKLAPMEERIYRFRCVEAWSMVVPWVGYPLAALLKAVEPTSKAKFVAFESLADPEQMPGLRIPVLDWPYKEGLRIDEAYNDLTLLTFGQYGRLLPNQSGAPVRLMVPWKYGFKSAKSIVRIRLTERQPVTSWNESAPREYGFFSNVNPNVNHPRWSQGSERRLGEGSLGGLFAPRRKTEMFNGYTEEVQAMYAGLDLKKWF